jgi:choline dehydrogenase-like flavoprotein
VIVVGSGPGGATVARELSRRGKRVLILERGVDVTVEESILGIASVSNMVPVSENLATARAFTTGGTSSIYFGVADEPPVESLAALGVQLSAQLAEVKRELPLGPLAERLLGNRAARVRAAAETLGYAWKKRSYLVDQSKCAAGYSHQAKWQARSYVQEAVSNGSCLVTRARVVKVLVESGDAIGVEYEVRRSRKVVESYRAFASKIVLAAGSLATPVILRNSGLEEAAMRGFYCQPGFVLSGTVKGLQDGDSFVGAMGTQLDEDIGLGDANSCRTIYRMFMLGNKRFLSLFSHGRSIGVGVIVNDALGGTLDERGSYHKTLSGQDRKKLAKGEAAARNILTRAGAKNLVRHSLSAGHCGGTVQINEHLDNHLQTRINHLHVCDGSVIPDTFRQSPTLTLICLGKYLAKHLTCAAAV